MSVKDDIRGAKYRYVWYLGTSKQIRIGIRIGTYTVFWQFIFSGISTDLKCKVASIIDYILIYIFSFFIYLAR